MINIDCAETRNGSSRPGFTDHMVAAITTHSNRSQSVEELNATYSTEGPMQVLIRSIKKSREFSELRQRHFMLSNLSPRQLQAIPKYFEKRIRQAAKG